MAKIELRTEVGDTRRDYLIEADRKSEKVPICITVGPVRFMYEGFPTFAGKTHERGRAFDNWEIFYSEEHEL